MQKDQQITRSKQLLKKAKSVHVLHPELVEEKINIPSIEIPGDSSDEHPGWQVKEPRNFLPVKIRETSKEIQVPRLPQQRSSSKASKSMEAKEKNRLST